MPNMNKNRVPMPEQDSSVRAKNFNEVSLGYTEKMACEEAQRCLNCKNKPCVDACPVNVDIPAFIKLISDGKFIEANSKIVETNSLPAVCGRVCPQESQCESKCVRGIKGEPVAIGRLERFAADFAANIPKKEIKKSYSNGHKVAIVGAGPAGLTCAGDLVRLGYDVTIFEAFHTAGGVLMYGIPEFRLPKKIVEREIKHLEVNGVKILTNMVIGKIFSIDDLLEKMGFEAVFIGSGAGLPRFMNIQGEGLIGVYSANEFLTRINLMNAYKSGYDTPIRDLKKTVVIGGGNVAMDAARCAIRLGAENVCVIYRRSIEELPARAEEVQHAREEGITFNFLCSPVRIIGNKDGEVAGIECIKMKLGDPDTSGRRKPIPIENSNFVIDADTVIVAIGTIPNPLLHNSTPGLEVNRHGCLAVDDNLMTSRKGVFAGGDAVTGAATVILAMGAGKRAAKSIDAFIKTKSTERK